MADAGRLLVLGKNGQVALELARIAEAEGREAVFQGREALGDAGAVDAGAVLDREQPTLVVNAAAYTAVDKAETEEAEALALNAELPSRFARACAARGLPFVHISTDYVFDGALFRPYREDDPLAPLGAYGRGKAQGETAVLEAGGPAAVIRTAWVYSAHGANFVKTMLRLAGSRDEVGVVADQIGCPTAATDVARACLLVGEALEQDPARARGLYHAAGGGEASWADLAEAVFALSAARGGPSAQVRRITTAEFPTPTRRPANSRLSCERLKAVTGWTPPPWRESLAPCVEALVPG